MKIKIYKTIILLWVCIGVKLSLVTLGEEHRLRVFENRVQRIFTPKRDAVAEGWRKLHNVLFAKYN
jgi:hypothetical protein